MTTENGNGKPEILEVPLAEMAAETQRMMTAARKGITCPNCGCQMFVFKTRQLDDEIDRRRKCRNCGTRISTMEVPVS